MGTNPFARSGVLPPARSFHRIAMGERDEGWWGGLLGWNDLRGEGRI